MTQPLPKLWIFVFLGVAVLVVAILVTGPSAPESSAPEEAVLEPTRALTFESMLVHGDNAIYVDNQVSDQSQVQVGFVVLSSPGFVVIFGDDDGVPGAMIGESLLMETGGEHIVVPVDRPLVQGEVYYALLYKDDGNGRFRLDEDTQVVDTEQSVILMNFIATNVLE